MIFIAGLCTGSFMNVLIYRLPRGIGTVKGRSFCPDCGHTLQARDLVPALATYSSAGAADTAKRPFAEIIWLSSCSTRCCGLAYAYKFHIEPAHNGAHFVFGSALLFIIFIVASHMLIYDRFNLAIALSGVAVAVDKYMYEHLEHHHEPFPLDVTVPERLIGALCVSGLFLLIALVSRGEWMGEGDIKLAAAAGLMLGWKNMLGVLFIASLTGSIGSLIYLGVIKRRMRRNAAWRDGMSADTSDRPGADKVITGAAAPPNEPAGDGGEQKRETGGVGETVAAAESGVEGISLHGHAVPFGPYLAAAMILMSFFGTEIIDFYLKLCGF